ncbi:Modulator of drug activity B [bioreactor metagenome]|uniref:Modulator of drug activity B n=1 Tax=bioreactor metagenome TaxID=1076179 RepID=A0A645HRH1_9ZZZZ
MILGGKYTDDKYGDFQKEMDMFNLAFCEVMLEGDGRTRADASRQYGSGGKMQGKRFMISATWNAPLAAFDNPNGELFGGKSTADLFLHITSNYKFVGYDVLPDFSVFDIYKSLDVSRSLGAYKTHLKHHCL